jgi:molybdopterin synthase catalytic subunit
MIVTILFFAQARECVGRPSLSLELPDGSRLADALAEVERQHPGLAALRPHLAIAVDQRLTAGDASLKGGAEIALLPPVSGG